MQVVTTRQSDEQVLLLQQSFLHTKLQTLAKHLCRTVAGIAVPRDEA